MYGIDECLYCGDKDSIEHSFIECTFTKMFIQKVVSWFNKENVCQISPTMRHYIHSNKLNSMAISIHEFIGKKPIEYNLENFSKICFIEKYSSLQKEVEYFFPFLFFFL